MDSDSILYLAMLTPLVTALLIVLNRRHRNRRELSVLAGGITLFLLIIQLVTPVEAGLSPELVLFHMLDELQFKLAVEPLGLIFSIVASILWLVNSIYSIAYTRYNAEKRQTRFYVFFAIAIFCAIGIAFSGNLLTLFIFYEGLTLSTYPLVVHQETASAWKAGRIYLGLLLSTSICFFLVAIIWVWQLTGTLEFSNGGILQGYLSNAHVVWLLLLFVYGVGKAALVPVHQWLPAAMIAPTPVSALLHAVAVVKAGVFTIVKVVVYIFGVDFLWVALEHNIFLYISGATIIYASVIALRTDNLKQRLAYSTISQLSYVIMATMILTPISIIGAILHIVAHAFGKITLFFAAGSIYTVTKKTKVSELAGIGHAMPVTMLAFTVACLSIIGIPLTAGFISKWHILQGAYAANAWFAIVVIVISTLLNASYFLPIVHMAFFQSGSNEQSIRLDEAPVTMLAALSLTAIMTLLFFIMPDWALNLAKLTVTE